MEGITDVVYRNAHCRWFYPADKYFTPFLVPDQGNKLPEKVLNEVSPVRNEVDCLVPQILTNRAEDFLDLAARLCALGYAEINLNLGCPSKTVTAKRKGSGFLAFPGALQVFLEKVFESPLLVSGQLKVSVKTRLGVSCPEEFDTLMDIYNAYPLSELIIHPRVQKEYYKGEVHLEEFTSACGRSRIPICYNGNLYKKEDFFRMEEAYPQVNAWMAGRGVLNNPGLFGEVNGQERAGLAQLKGFHDEIYSAYSQTVRSEKALLARMKEFWNALGGPDCIFLNPLMKMETGSIFRMQRLDEYNGLVRSLLERV